MKLLKLENLIYFTIIILPSYLLRFTVLGMPTNVLDIFIGLVFIVYLAKMYQAETRQRLVSTGRHNKTYITSIGLIFLGLLISTLANKNYAVGFGIIKSWFVLPVIFSYIAVSTIEDKSKIFYFLYLSAFLVSIIGIIYKISGIVTFDGRLQAFFNSPNYLAMYLTPGIIIGIIMLAQSQKSKVKSQNFNLKFKILLVSLLIILATLYYTFSYAAWMAVIIAVALLAVIKNKKNSRRLVLLFGSILILISVLLTQIYSEKLTNLIYSNRSSLASRIMIWQSAGKILGDNWVLGIGPGNFQEKYLEYQKYFPPYLEWAVPHPHNLYLAFWLYGGILGIFGILGLIFIWLKNILSKMDDNIKFIALGMILYFLIHGLVDTTYFKNDLSVIFWLAFWAGI